MQYWLMKSEPSCYSIEDLKREKVGMWDDVRNYQARNFMREMRKGDMVLFYHSSTNPAGVAGLAKVAREAYPDPTQFDTNSEKYDPKSPAGNPRWSAVDVRFVKKFREPVTLHALKNDPFFADMPLLQPGSRLSVQPVSPKHFNAIVSFAA